MTDIEVNPAYYQGDSPFIETTVNGERIEWTHYARCALFEDRKLFFGYAKNCICPNEWCVPFFLQTSGGKSVALTPSQARALAKAINAILDAPHPRKGSIEWKDD